MGRPERVPMVLFQSWYARWHDPQVPPMAPIAAPRDASSVTVAPEAAACNASALDTKSSQFSQISGEA